MFNSISSQLYTLYYIGHNELFNYRNILIFNPSSLSIRQTSKLNILLHNGYNLRHPDNNGLHELHLRKNSTVHSYSTVSRQFTAFHKVQPRKIVQYNIRSASYSNLLNNTHVFVVSQDGSLLQMLFRRSITTTCRLLTRFVHRCNHLIRSRLSETFLKQIILLHSTRSILYNRLITLHYYCN